MTVTRRRAFGRGDASQAQKSYGPVRRLARVGLALAFAVTVAACGKEPPPRGSVRGCPEVGILADAAKIVKFLPSSERDVTDVLYQGEITDVSLDCSTRRETLSLDLAIQMTGELGPATPSSRKHTMRIFVAVLRGREGVAKRVYRVPVEWDPETRYAGIRHTVEGMTFPTDDSIDPESYEVLIGYDLLDEEIRYNRAQPGFK